MLSSRMFIFSLLNLCIFSCNVFADSALADSALADSALLEGINPILLVHMCKIAGESVGKGAVDALGKIPEEMIRKIIQNAAHGATEELKLFGEDSDFHTTLKASAHSTGVGVANFLKGIDSRLWPFIIKYGLVTAVSLATITTGYYGTKFFWNYVQHRLINPPPKFIIESSKQIGLFGRLKNWVFGGPQMPQMVFAPELEQRLDNLVIATKNINAKIKAGYTNIKYRNILLYGPPGTGKTMFALRLAKQSYMEFVVVTGSSFFQEGAGIKAIDELFSWAKRKKGLCIFIDEADSLLVNRTDMKADSENYRLVNHFLNYLGERSDKFMIILATNHMSVFDEAMQRRIDDAIEMPLPKQAERFRTLQLYRDTILRDVKQNGQAFVDSVDLYLTDAKLHEITSQTDSFSYGDLQGIINTLKSEADITDDGLVTSRLIDKVVTFAREKKEAFAATKKTNQVEQTAPAAYKTLGTILQRAG